MAKNKEIQSPIYSSLEAKLREMKTEDRQEVTIALGKPFGDSFNRLSLYLSVKGIKGYLLWSHLDWLLIFI